MSLAWRILLFVLLLNVLTLGTVQVYVYRSQSDWFQREREAATNSVLSLAGRLSRVYTPQALRSAGSDARLASSLITNATIQELYDDAIVTSGRPPYDGFYLNPRGAVHRDPDTFSQAEIERAMQTAREVDDGTVPVAGGSCYAIRLGEEVTGFLWFLPKHPTALPTALPVWGSVLAIGIGAAVFGILLFWGVRRTVGTPLHQLQAAASAVAHGSYAVRLPEMEGQADFAPVMNAFNLMARRVEDHTTTLEREVRRAVDEAKQKEQALVLSARLASIGTLAAGVAHEINNPIGGMQNAVNRLLQNPDLGERQRTYLLLVQDGLVRIARTTRRLLDFRPRQVEAAPFALAAAIEGARALVEHRVQQHGVELKVQLPTDLPLLRGDEHEIQQVLLNLFLNSLDALEARGRGGAIAVTAELRERAIHLFVDDDGPGMDPADLGRVFDPFFTKKERPDASGLGMFICYSIVHNHGGEMTVRSAVGDGFHVHIVLPVA